MRWLALLLLAGCHVPDEVFTVGTPGDGAAGDGAMPDSVLKTTIKQLRMNPPPTGTPVSLSGVVVTARGNGTNFSRIWVQDAGGGQYSGIQLFCKNQGSLATCSLTDAQVDALPLGAIVDVTGIYRPFTPSAGPPDSTMLEIDAPMITTTGATASRNPIDVTAGVLAKAQTGTSTDPYKGCFVHLVNDLKFTVSSTAALEFQVNCIGPSGNGQTYNGFEAIGSQSAQTVAIGLFFEAAGLTYCLPCSTGGTCSNPITTNQMLPTVSGVVEPAYTNGTLYLEILPAADSDL